MKILENFADWLRLYEADSASNSFRFNFPQGKWAEADVDAASLAEFRKGFEPMIATMKNPKQKDIKYSLEIVASTSNSPVGPELKASLAKAGYATDKTDTSGNAALCAARLATVTSIVKRELASSLGINIADPRFASKIEISTSSKPNSGGTADPNDPGNKAFQYIGLSLRQTSTSEPDPNSFTCNMPFATITGVQAGPEISYVGYEVTRFISAAVGNEVEISFNPIVIPDAFYMKYGNQEFLSPFVGERTQPASVTNPRNFVQELGAIEGLQSIIDKKIASVGGSLTCASVMVGSDPAWVGGKPKVYANPMYFPKFKIKRNMFDEDLTIIVFSPLGETRFSISSKCK